MSCALTCVRIDEYSGSQTGRHIYDHEQKRARHTRRLHLIIGRCNLPTTKGFAKLLIILCRASQLMTLAVIKLWDNLR
jgi:hypothetical protein